MSNFLQYMKANSHAILATLVVVQNLHLFHGFVGAVLSSVVEVASAFGAQ